MELWAFTDQKTKGARKAERAVCVAVAQFCYSSVTKRSSRRQERSLPIEAAKGAWEALQLYEARRPGLSILNVDCAGLAQILSEYFRSRNRVEN